MPHGMWSTSENASHFSFVDAEKIYFFSSTPCAWLALNRARVGLGSPADRPLVEAIQRFCRQSVKISMVCASPMSERVTALRRWL